MENDTDILSYAKYVIEVEKDALAKLVNRMDASFEDAVRAILGCKGQTIVSGMGKAGIIAQKISATMASTGTPSIFIHPAEAIHGDLGRIRKDDIVILLSNSGTSEEVVRLIPPIKKIGARIIAMTGSPESPLGEHADIVLDVGKIDEACPLGMAPSASTTVLLALGDALALTVLKLRDFDLEDFALYHPGGALGRRFLTVDEVMRKGEDVPTVRTGSSVKDALLAHGAAKRRSGAIVIVDAGGALRGIFTDGDIRRLLMAESAPLEKRIDDVMTRSPKSVKLGALAAEALLVMREKKIDELPVTNESGRLEGLIDVQDLITIGMV
ncbi:MAG: KpsF/GutQ family sugar-phosphate isomerase [Planctomycetes bacterium]|nr:KpsF/GutQ family sugar-phosphate isomerase [Planctomycetota bacterium]